MLSAIAGVFSSAAFGGITGLFGTLISKVGDYYALKQKNAFDLAMRDKDMAIAQIEATKEVTIAQDTNAANREIAESEVLGKSYEADRATYLTPDVQKDVPPKMKGIVALAMAVVDFVRGMTRPGLTLYLCILTTLMYLQMKAIVTAAGQQAFTPADAVKIIILIVDAVIYLTTVTVTWWFGTRPKATK